MTARVVLLLGANGQLGRELRVALAPLGCVVAADRTTCDLRDASSLARTMRDVRPSIVVNAAAYTAVDRAEECADEAWAVNAAAPGVVAEEARTLGATLVHYSTDYVFDGHATAPYRETDAPSPVNVYGASKRGGERAIAEVGGRAIVLRVGWLHSTTDGNFVGAMLRLARQRASTGEAVRVVSDQRGTPTSCRFVAETTAHIVAHPRAANAEPNDDVWGLYHLAASGDATWHDLARAVFTRAESYGVPAPFLVPITTAEYGARARRPAFSVLDTRRVQRTFGVRPTSWQTQLADALAQRFAVPQFTPRAERRDAVPR